MVEARVDRIRWLDNKRRVRRCAAHEEGCDDMIPFVRTSCLVFLSYSALSPSDEMENMNPSLIL